MFIPYSGPSAKKDAGLRRAVNAYVAADAGSRRRRKNKEVEGDRRIKPGGTLQWIQMPVSRSDDPQEPREDPWNGRRRSRTDCAVGRSLGSGKFYPLTGMGSKGPLTMRAISHYFDVLLPHDAKALGLGEKGVRSYTTGLLSWASRYDVILHGLSAFTLCSLESQDSSGTTSRAILYHRNKLLSDLHDRLSRREVDDVLIQAICLLIPVDDYLGNVEFGPVHLKGLQDVVKIRGGFEEVGRSDADAFGKNLQMSMMVVTSMVEFHLQTSITKLTSAPMIPFAAIPDMPEDLQDMIYNLPPGFQDLIHSGDISENMIKILESFSSWLSKNEITDITGRETWRYSVSENLNNLEKCIIVTLACLADDLSSMSTHPAALIFRKSKQRMSTLATVPELWSNPALVDCMIWMCTVVATPQHREVFCRDAQKTILRKAVWQRFPEQSWEDIRVVLQRFYYDSARAASWEGAWNTAFGNCQIGVDGLCGAPV